MLKKLLKKIRGETDMATLVKRGLKIGKDYNIQKGCIIDDSHSWLITIGDNVTFAPNVHILAHDASTKKCLGYTRIGIVEIGDNVFIGAGSIVLPNVRIGSDSVIGAGSVVTKDVPHGSVAVGVPARVVCTLEEFKARNSSLMAVRPVYEEAYTMSGGITEEQKQQQKDALTDGIGFVR